MPSKIARNKIACAVSGLVLTLLMGCAGYQLGPTNGVVAGTKSIQIVPFANETLQPRLSEAVTEQLRKKLQQDGTFRLETVDPGDIVVTGVITKFDRSELSFDPKDVVTVRDYTVSIGAQVTAVERISGKTNLSQLVFGQTTLRVGSDMTSAERQAIPLLAADLARRITNLLVDGTW